MTENALTLTAALILLPLSVFPQHRDESQMLRKPLIPTAHARVHNIQHLSTFPDTTLCLTDSATYLPGPIPTADIATADAAAALCTETSDVEEGGTYLAAGIEMLRHNDAQAALKNFGAAARRGNHEAQYRIGLMYRDGTGLKPDATEAAYWFRKAGSNGHTQAQYEIAVCFDKGAGVLQDSRVAAEWYWRAAERGHPEASFRLAQMYRDGIGMKADIRRAAHYMSIAADAGLQGAEEALADIRRMLPATPSPSGKATTAKRQKSVASSSANGRKSNKRHR